VGKVGLLSTIFAYEYKKSKSLNLVPLEFLF
jgi:hypothetical protein